MPCLRATDGRRQRGLVIAATAAIAKKGEAWLVPSQSLNGKYRVEKGPDGFHCTCPAYELRGLTCKHDFEVEFVLRRETKPDGTATETRAARVTYPQQWSAYNRVQTTEKEQFCALLRDLVSGMPTPDQKRGRPALPLADMIFSAASKVYSTVSARRFMTDLRGATALDLILGILRIALVSNCHRPSKWATASTDTAVWNEPWTLGRMPPCFRR